MSSEIATGEPATVRQNAPPSPAQSAKVRQTPPSQPPPDDASEQAADDPRNPNYLRGTERLAHELARGFNLRRAAERAGLSERTAQRRWADAGFRQKVLEVRAELRFRSTGKLASVLVEAARTLRQALQSKSESVRVSAARAIFRLFHQMGGQQEENALLASSLEDLRQQLHRAMQGMPEDSQM